MACSVVDVFQGLQVQIAGDDRPGGLDDRASLGETEAVELELVWLDGCELLGGGKRARAVGVVGHGSSTVGDEAVEQMDPHGKR